MRFLVKVLKGVLIGISVVIPGVSGGSMAMSMGIYDQLIEVITIGKGTRGKLGSILPYGLGVLLGVALFAYFIEIMFSRFPLPTTCLFIGMILGALPMLLKQVRGERFTIRHGFVLLCTMAIMILLPIAGSQAGKQFTLSPSLPHALLATGLGLIGAATMIVPGVSGSMVLMLLGYYTPVLQQVNAFTTSLLRLNMPGMLESLAILGPFCLGVLAGMVLMARLVRALLRRFPCATYYGIIGLVLASPFAVLYQQQLSGVSTGSWLIGAGLAAAGFFVATLLGKGEPS